MKGGESVTEFEKVYRTYFNDVFLYIRNLSHDEYIAEEITSDTFFKAMNSINSFRSDCDIRVWLCQIAKNCYFSYLKKAGRVDSIEDIDILNIPAQGKTLEEQFVQQEESAQIQKILHDLPEPYKEVFMWRIFAELSFKQIAQIFGKTENWACVTYHRARKMIKEKAEVEKNEK